MDIANQNLVSELVDFNPSLAYVGDVYQRKGEVNKNHLYDLFHDYNQYTDFDRFFDTLFLDFEKFQQVHSQHEQKKLQQFFEFSKQSKSSLIDFFKSVKKFKMDILKDQKVKFVLELHYPNFLNDFKIIPDLKLNFETIPGRNPSTWPHKLQDFINNLKNLPFYTFFQQPIKIHSSYLKNYKNKQKDLVKKVKGKNMQDKDFLYFCQIIQAHFLSSILKGSFYRIIDTVQLLKDMQQYLSNDREQILTKQIKESIKSLIKEIIYDVDKQQLDFKPMFAQVQSKFSILDTKIQDFTVNEYAIATDGTFIYEAINQNQMIMLKKIGSGKNNSKAGVVYMKNTVSSCVKGEFSMVCLNGNLYIPDEHNAGSLNIYSTETLQHTGNINLSLQSYFQNAFLAQYNRCFQIFSDGNYLYTVLIKLQKEELQIDEQQKQKEEEQKQQEDNKKNEQKQVDNTEEIQIKKDDKKKKQKKDKQQKDTPTKKQENEVQIKEEKKEQQELTLQRQNQINPPKKDSLPKIQKQESIIMFKNDADSDNIEITIKNEVEKTPENQIKLDFYKSIRPQRKGLYQQLISNPQRNHDDPIEDSLKDKICDFMFNSESSKDNDTNLQIHKYIEEKLKKEEKLQAKRMQRMQEKQKKLREKIRELEFTDFGKSALDSQIFKELDSSLKKDDFLNLRSINIIKNLFKNQIMQEEEIMTQENLEQSEPDINNKNVYQRFLLEKELEKLHQGGLHRVRNTALKAKELPKKEVQQNDKVLYKICFYVVKFDINKNQNYYTEEQKAEFRKNADIQELYESFDEMFTYEECAHSYYKCDQDLEISAKYLIKKGQRQNGIFDVNSLEEVMIYQTFSQNIDFEKQQPLKGFSVTPNSILVPQDIVSGNWFIKGNKLLKSTGQLFSIDQRDQIEVLPDKVDKNGSDIFSERRNSKLHKILCNENLDPEYVDTLYQQLLDDTEDYQLTNIPLIRNATKDKSDKSKKIITTFLKSYNQSFFIKNPLTQTCYDNVNNQFITINLFKIPKTSYNFVKQTIQYNNDNFWETKQLKKLISISKEKLKNPFLFYLEILKSKNLSEFLQSILEFVLWVNVYKNKCQQRLNKWELIYQQKLTKLSNDDKKKRQTYQSKINKLKDRRLKKLKENQQINYLEENQVNFQEIRHVKYLCIKGNLKNYLKLQQLKESYNNELSVINEFEKLLFCNLNFTHKLNDFELFKKYIIDHLNKNINPQNIWLIALDYNLFKEVLLKTQQQNTSLFFELLEELFSKISCYQNHFSTNEKMLLKPTDQNDLKLNCQQIETCELQQIKYKLQKLLTEEKDFIYKIFELSEKQSMQKKLKVYCICRKLIELELFFECNTDSQQSESLFFLILKQTQNLLQYINHEEYNQLVEEELVNYINYISLFIINIQIVNFKEIQSILDKIFEILQQLKPKYLQIQDLQNNICNENLTPGISTSDIYIAETPHPIERGQVIHFRKIFKPKAIGFLVHFDKRCQDEENSDNLIITTNYSDEPQGSLSSLHNAILSRNITITFKKKEENVMYMLGNTISVKFTSSLVAKQNIKSLNQWGYKIYIRPIYGNQQFKENNFNEFSMQRSIESMVLSFRFLLDCFLKGKGQVLNVDQQQILQWSIFQKGLTSLKRDKYLQKVNEMYQVVNQDSLSKNNIQSVLNESEVQSQNTMGNDIISLGQIGEVESQDLDNLLSQEESGVQKLIQYIKKQVMPPMILTMEKQRPFFSKEMQNYWNKVEDRVLLCYIKHTNLLRLINLMKNQDISFVLKQINIQDQLIQIGKKRNIVLRYMLKLMKTEKDFQDSVKYIFDSIKEYCIENIVRPRIMKKIEDQEKKLQKKSLLHIDKKKVIRNLIQQKKKNKRKKSKQETPSISQDQQSIKKIVKDDTENYYLTKEDFEQVTSNETFKKQIYGIIVDKFENNLENFEEIFVQKKINYIREKKVNYETFIKKCLDYIQNNLVSLKNDKFKFEIKTNDPYQLAADIIRDRCDLLLKIENEVKTEVKEEFEFGNLTMIKEKSLYMTKEQDVPEDEFLPIGVKRSLTSDSHSKKMHRKKKEKLDWIEKYQKWKKNMTNRKENLKSDDCSPSFAVTQFLTYKNPLNIQNLLSLFLKDTHRATLRVIGFQYYNKIWDFVYQTSLENFINNLASSSYKNLDLFQGIELSNQDFKKAVQKESTDLMLKFIQKIVSYQKQLHNLTPQIVTFNKKNFSTKNQVVFEQFIEQINNFLKNMIMMYSEIFTFINNNLFQNDLESLLLESVNLELIKQFIQFNIEIGLLYFSLKHLSNYYREIVALSKNLFDISFSITNILYIKIGSLGNELLYEFIFKEVYYDEQQQVLKKVYKNDQLDILHGKRLIYLLNMLYIKLNYNKKQNIQNNNTQNIKRVLITILQQSQMLTITQQCINCLQLLEIQNDLNDKNLLKNLKSSSIKLDQKFIDQIQQKNSKIEDKQKLYNDNRQLETQLLFNQDKTVLENIIIQMGSLLEYNQDDLNQKNWKIFLHLEQVESLIPLIRVFFYWEKLYPSFSKKLPNNMKEFREYKKNNIKDQLPKTAQKSNISPIQKTSDTDTIKMKLKLNETLLQKSPLIDPLDIQKNLGWFFNIGDQFKDFRQRDEKLKEIILKQSQNMIDTKQVDLFLTTLNDQIKLLELPRQKELKLQREKQKIENLKDPFDDEYGYCLDLLFNDYENLEEVNKQIQDEKKELIKKSFKGLQKAQTSKELRQQLKLGKMQFRDKLLQKRSELLQQDQQILFAKKEKPKSQEIQKDETQKVRRKRSEYIVEKRKQEEEFLDTFRNLKILQEVTKTVNYIGSLMNFTGHSEIIINNQFFQQNQQKTKEFCSYFEALCQGTLQKIDGMQINDQQILQNLKNFLLAINKTPRRKKFQYSLIRSDLCLQINMFNNLGKLKVKDQEFCKEANKNQALIYNEFQGIAKSAKIRAIKNFVYDLTQQNENVKKYIQEKLKYYLSNDYNDENKFERAGYFLLISDWHNDKILGETFQDAKSKETFQILANKLNTGRLQTLGAKFSQEKAIITSLKQTQDLQENLYQQYFDFQDCQNILTEYIIQNIKIINSQEFDFYKKFEFAAIMNVLKSLFTKNDWILDQKFQEILDKNFVQSKDYYQKVHKQFIQSCEAVMNMSFIKQFTVPQDMDKKIQAKYICNKKKVTFNPKEPEKKEDQKVQIDFIEKQSSHLAEMKTNQKKVSEYKMLKYWEKNVIPKIYNFVKGSLSNFEIKDFFEQMRIELRKENHSQASHIAYILCDQKLPNNCYIPGLNYDWNSLDLDEISIGQWVLIKIKDDTEFYSPLLEDFYKIGINQVLAQVIQKDFNHSIVNVLISNLCFSQCYNVWIPQQAIKQIKTCINYPSTFYQEDTLKNQFKTVFKKFCQVLSREISVRNFERQKNLNENKTNFEKLKKIAEFELKGHCLKSWISCNGNYLDKDQQQTNLNSIALKITEKNNQDQILEHLQEESNLIIDFFNNFYYECDLEKQLKDQQLQNFKAQREEGSLSNLNVFKQDEYINGLTVEFKQPSNLYKCSGLKIYSDRQGINMTCHLSANQSEDNCDLQPLVFQDPNVYYVYYYNKEAVPAYISENQTTFTSLKVKVHAIPTSWNYLMWLFDIVSTKAFEKKDIKLLKKLLVVFIEFFNKFKGPSVAQKYVYELFTRILIKIKNIDVNNERFDILENFDMQKIITDYTNRINGLKENDLVPNLVQQMTEFISIYYLLAQQLKFQNQKFTVPQNIQQVSQIFDMADFLHCNKILNKKTAEDFRKMMQPNNLNKQIFIIKNIPKLSQQVIKNIIIERAQLQKMKILLPDLDVYIPLDDNDLSVGYVVVLFDGWEVPGIEDLKQEEEEEEEEEEKVEVERQWECDRCTFLNPDITAVCQICEAPKPANPRYPNEEVQQVEEKEEIPMFCFKSRLNEYKNQLLQDFNRVTPDKRISIDSYEDKIDQLNTQNEFLEFLMIRIINENFQENLQQICQDIYKENKQYLEEFKEIKNCDELFEYLQNLEPYEMFNMLFDFGYDYWLEKICPSKYTQIIKLLDKKSVQQFQRFIEEDLEKDVKEIDNLSPFNFRIEFKNKLRGIKQEDDNFLKNLSYRESKQFYYNSMKLNYYTNCEFKTTLNAIYFLNQLMSDNFKYVNILVSEEEDVKENSICLKFGALLFNVKDYFSSFFKNEFSQKILQHTSQARDQTPRVIIERLTKEKQILSAKNDTQKQEEKNSSFLQGFKQLQKISPTNLRPQKPKGSDPFICFEIVFKGEHVMGEGGPYRQFFADIVQELQQKENDLRKLNLLIPTPNQVSESGDYKDKFTINPSLKTPYHLQLYEYLGLLMGCAFRTETFLSLDLPTIFWKKMVNEQIVEKDIEELDLGVTELIKFVKNSSNELFEDTVFENFTTFLSDKTVVELVPNGAQKKVDSKNRYEYIQKTIQVRLSEADVQIDYIRKGFSQIVPKVLLAVYNAKDLEKKICGNKEVDFQLLKKNTRYSGGLKENSDLIQNFWQVLFELSDKDKLLFVKFCWGQERLPSTLQAFANQSNRFMIKPAQYSGNQDGILPRADTCFFNFELPNYSSKEIMREKILLAIHTDCNSMNAEEIKSEQGNDNAIQEEFYEEESQSIDENF